MSSEFHFREPPLEQVNSILFQIPREIRDKIYHEIHLGNGNNSVYSPSFTIPTWGDNFEYLGLTYLFEYWGPNCPRREIRRKNPNWLWTCKAIMLEGTAQYLRGAVWVWRPHKYRVSWRSILPLNITKMELWVDNLDHYQTPRSTEYGTIPRYDLEKAIEGMRAAGVRLEKLKLAGRTAALQPATHRGPHCNHQSGNMIRNLLAKFDGVVVSRWEFGIKSSWEHCWVPEPGNYWVPKPGDYWVVFEWVWADRNREDTGGDGKLKLLEFQVHPEPSLEDWPTMKEDLEAWWRGENLE